MRITKPLSALLIGLLILGNSPAKAEDIDPVADRAAKVELIKIKYITTLDAQHSTLIALRTKMKVEPTLLKQVNSVISDFESNYKVIVVGLANPNQDTQSIIDLCEEEIGEFDNSIYSLKQMAAKIKTINCVKSKTIKQVTGLAPKCPSGYKKK